MNGKINTFLRGFHCLISGIAVAYGGGLIFIAPLPVGTPGWLENLDTAMIFPLIIAPFLYITIFSALPKKNWQLLTTIIPPYFWLLIQAVIFQNFFWQDYFVQFGVVSLASTIFVYPLGIFWNSSQAKSYSDFLIKIWQMTKKTVWPAVLFLFFLIATGVFINKYFEVFLKPAPDQTAQIFVTVGVLANLMVSITHNSINLFKAWRTTSSNLKTI